MDPKYFRRIKFSFSHREKVPTYLPAYLWLKSDQNSRKGRLDNGPNYGSDRAHSVSSYAAHATTFLPIYHRHLFVRLRSKIGSENFGVYFWRKNLGCFRLFWHQPSKQISSWVLLCCCFCFSWSSVTIWKE